MPTKLLLDPSPPPRFLDPPKALQGTELVQGTQTIIPKDSIDKIDILCFESHTQPP